MLVTVKSVEGQVSQNQTPHWLVHPFAWDYFQANSSVGTRPGDRKRQEAESLAKTQVLLWLHLKNIWETHKLSSANCLGN